MTQEGGAMEVDLTPLEETPIRVEFAEDIEDEEDEDVADLVELMESSEEASAAADKIPILSSLLREPKKRFGSKATSLKERSVYALTRSYCETQQYSLVVDVLTGNICHEFFANITKAKCAKVVRQVLDIVCSLAPNELNMQEKICNNIIAWCKAEKRTFLRQRAEAKLASVLFEQDKYGPALTLIDRLLVELKKLDDKQLLVETHLMESKIHFGLQNLPKAKSALTASRTCANAIYVAPGLQATIDSMSGILHCEEGDYDTAHSYFLESFEQLDQMNDQTKAVPCLKYMMLCRILDSLHRALKLSAKGGVGTLHCSCILEGIYYEEICFTPFESACLSLFEPDLFYFKIIIMLSSAQGPRAIAPRWTFPACFLESRVSSMPEGILRPCRLLLPQHRVDR